MNTVDMNSLITQFQRILAWHAQYDMKVTLRPAYGALLDEAFRRQGDSAMYRRQNVKLAEEALREERRKLAELRRILYHLGLEGVE